MAVKERHRSDPVLKQVLHVQRTTVGKQTLVLSGTDLPPSQSYCQEWCDWAEVEHPHCCLPVGSRPGPRPQECQARPGSALPTCPSTRAARAECLSSQGRHLATSRQGVWGLAGGAGALTGKLGPHLGWAHLWRVPLHTHPTLTPSLPPVRATNCVCVCLLNAPTYTSSFHRKGFPFLFFLAACSQTRDGSCSPAVAAQSLSDCSQGSSLSFLGVRLLKPTSDPPFLTLTPRGIRKALLRP